MSIDPSSIPNFGSQPEPDQPSGGPTANVVIPDQDLVKQLLDQMGLKHAIDDEDDLLAPWEEFRTYFMFRGEAQQHVFAVRTFYERTYSVDEKAQLHEAIDEWNHLTLWPKVYTNTDDEGAVRLVGEAQMLIGMGVNLDHFVATTVSWVQASIEFNKWLGERLGLEEAADGDSDGEGGSDSGSGDSGDGSEG
ncbi:YbjN domain-containing protein [Streptomyces sp. NBC_00448]|uniref:YbjN domain-containing protein n=1 Tax=Streptomyces sp. NBC_00448 TaxID=2903652 RepID=UPI002E1F6E21